MVQQDNLNEKKTTFQRDLAWQLIELTNRSSVSHQFARYALTLNYNFLPDYVVHQAKRCILDAMGCAIGAFDAPGRFICEEVVKEIGGPQEATVFGSGLRTTALNATLVNSLLVRFLDFNDIGGGGHNSDCISSLLAVAEREQKSGKDLLTSLVISYELGERFKEAANYLGAKGWTTDVRAGLNQPPAIGKLMGMTEDQIANAIGLCMSHSLPLNILDSNRDENVMAKSIRFGWTAHDAILACMLAKRGFTGPERIIESETAGIRKIIAQDDLDLEKLVDFSGWRIMKTVFKGIAANITTHGHVYATLAIVKEQDLKPEDILAVRIKAPPREAAHTTTPAKKYPRNAESADHSAFYANAHVIKERSFGAESSKPERFTDPVILGLIEKMTVEPDSSLSILAGASEITTQDGRKFSKRIDKPRGLVDPLSDQELEEKFRENASNYLGTQRIMQLIDTIWNLEKMDSASDLAKLMVLPQK